MITKFNFILLLFITLNIITCKKNKLKEHFDPEWREKYSDISYNTCKKLESCFWESIKKLNPNLQSLAKSEVKPDKCIEKSKKSKIYLLKVKNPDEAKQVATECFLYFEKLSCEDLKQNKLEENSACKIVRLLQTE